MIGIKKGLPAKVSPSQKLPKKIIALQALVHSSMNALEALSLYNEMNHHSTLAALSNIHGIEFDRVYEPHTRKDGGKTKFVRYTLKESSRKKAINLLSHYGVKVAA